MIPDNRSLLASMIRSHLPFEFGAKAALARRCGVTSTCVGDILSGDAGVSASLLDRMADALGVDSITRDRWHSLAGHVAPDVAAALLASPERWGEVRALLAEVRRG